MQAGERLQGAQGGWGHVAVSSLAVASLADQVVVESRMLTQTAQSKITARMKPEPNAPPQEVLAGLVERVTFGELLSSLPRGMSPARQEAPCRIARIGQRPRAVVQGTPRVGRSAHLTDGDAGPVDHPADWA
jgi:hypothetical protein